MTPRPVKVLLVLCVWCCPFLAHGQEGRSIDSLIAKVDDSSRLPESVILLLSEQVSRYSNPEELALIHDRISFAYCSTGALDSATAHAWKVLRLVPNDLRLCSRAYRTLGFVAYRKDALGRAGDFYQRAYRISRELNDEKSMMEALTYLGRVEFGQSHPAESRDQYQHALELALKIPDSSKSNQLKFELVPVYRSLGDYRQAQELLYDLMRRYSQEKTRLSGLYKEFGLLEEARRAPRKALRNYRGALELDRQEGNPASAWQLIAQTYFQLNSLDTARLYMDSVEQELNYHHDLVGLRDCFRLKYRIADQQNDTIAAYLNFLRYDTYDDSVRQLEEAQRIRHVRDELILSANEAAMRTTDLESQLHATRGAQETLWDNFLVIGGGSAVLFILLGVAWYLTRMRLQSKVEEGIERARKVEVDKEKLFAVISHDLQDSVSTFNNLTRSIGSQLKNATAEERNNLLLHLNATSLELRQSLNELQEWILSQSGTMPFSADLFSCRQLAGAVEEDLRLMAEEHGVKIDFLIPDVLMAYGDKSMIGMVLRTLLFHAIRAGHEGQTVTIFSGSKENLITLGVKSTGTIRAFDDATEGVGMDSGYRGLGPSLCRDLVRRNGGELFTETSSGQGATIFITLPERPIAN